MSTIEFTFGATVDVDLSPPPPPPPGYLAVSDNPHRRRNANSKAERKRPFFPTFNLRDLTQQFNFSLRASDGNSGNFQKLIHPGKCQTVLCK